MINSQANVLQSEEPFHTASGDTAFKVIKEYAHVLHIV